MIEDISIELEKLNFNWRFCKGNKADAANPDYDDSNWDTVNLPHDWAAAGPFGAPADDGGTGKLPWQGQGWYRKTFTLPAESKGKRLQFTFNGIMSSPIIFLNGQQVGSWIYGYNSFWIEATDAANFGGRNVLAIHADTREHRSRWYPGAGIYRTIEARLVESIHIPIWGVWVTTPDVSDKKASVMLEIEVVNTTDKVQDIIVETTIANSAGMDVAKVVSPHNAVTDATHTIHQQVIIKDPICWDTINPHLYRASTRILIGQKEIDHAVTSFGIRTFNWTADDGFHLNGQRVQLQGVNLHHDHGPLGAAFYPRAMERQLEIMKEMGVNAIRTSHNAVAPDVLDLCDRMGIIVLNELFDKYGPTAGIDCESSEFINKYAEREVKNVVLRDRNHPSVCLWSIGNEIDDLKKEFVDKMVGYYKTYDPTRPTSIGSHIPAHASDKLITALDTSGWNYARKYMSAKTAYPDMPLIYTETASAYGTRGAYKLTLPEDKTYWGNDGEVTAYGLTSAGWSDIPEIEFERIRKDTFVAGEFVWTGFDYLGEPTPFGAANTDNKGRKARSSYFGICDLVGLPKDSYYNYRSHWHKTSNTVKLTPHWNWEGHEGQQIPVIVYTNGDEAELFLNGKSLGRRKKRDPDSIETPNLAYGKPATAGSEEHIQDELGNVLDENLAGKAVNGDLSTCWRAATDELPQYWQVDLEHCLTISRIVICWTGQAKEYDFNLDVSLDGTSWSTIEYGCKSEGSNSFLNINKTNARFVKVNITDSGNERPGIKEFNISKNGETSSSPYYDIVDAYRLRWNDVSYQPGELNVVAYRHGEKIGEDIVRTAGQPAKLRLTADRKELNADGMDLAYINVELTDEAGNLCPLAMDSVTFKTTGAAEIAGIGNGNQMGHTSFQSNTFPLFYGKAVVIMRSIPDKSGFAELSAITESGITAKIQLMVSGEVIF